MREALELLDDDGDADLVHFARDDEAFVCEAFFADGDEDGRGVFPEVLFNGEGGDERVVRCASVAVEIDAWGIAWPDVVFGDGEWVVDGVGGLGGRNEVVEVGIVGNRWHGTTDIAPRRGGGHAPGEVNGYFISVEANGGRDATKRKEGLQQAQR